MQINWRWPQKRNNGLVPWYVVLRRLIFLPLLLIGKVLRNSDNGWQPCRKCEGRGWNWRVVSTIGHFGPGGKTQR